MMSAITKMFDYLLPQKLWSSKMFALKDVCPKKMFVLKNDFPKKCLSSAYLVHQAARRPLRRLQPHPGIRESKEVVK